MTEPVRTVYVQSPSGLRETGNVVAAVFHIVYWSTLVSATTWGRDAKPTPAAVVATDEVAFTALPSTDQRRFRACLDGVSAAEDLRGTTGAWPSVAMLAAAGAPPFADPLDTDGYHWTVMIHGTLINYQGVPRAGSERPAILVSVLEPDPGTPIDPGATPDETHHRLRDGTLIHVSIWEAGKPLVAPMWVPPFETGWRRVSLPSP